MKSGYLLRKINWVYTHRERERTRLATRTRWQRFVDFLHDRWCEIAHQEWGAGAGQHPWYCQWCDRYEGGERSGPPFPDDVEAGA